LIGPIPVFLLRDKTKPGREAGFFVALAKKQYGGSASFPLRFRHSARDNAVHRPTKVEDGRKSRNLLER
jgi:hypothetical protein